MNDIVAILVFLVVWIAVSRFILPRLGVPT